MRLSTPRSEQGQTVERSYGWDERGEYYRRTEDRSALSVTWHRADPGSRDRLQSSEYDAGGANFPPVVNEWIPCAEPEDDAS